MTYYGKALNSDNRSFSRRFGQYLPDEFFIIFLLLYLPNVFHLILWLIMAFISNNSNFCNFLDFGQRRTFGIIVLLKTSFYDQIAKFPLLFLQLLCEEKLVVVDLSSTGPFGKINLKTVLQDFP